MRRLVHLALQNPVFVLVMAAGLAVAGLLAYRQLDIEAYPDPVPPLVEVITQPDGWSAEEAERAVTVPLEIGLSGMPGLDHVRSQSVFGLSDVKCYFTWGTSYEQARQEVINRLQFISLPKGLTAQLSPWNAIGEVYRYTVRGKGYSLEQLKTAQDWILEKQFKQVPGVIDVTAFGGEIRQYQVEIDPVKMRGRGLQLTQVMNAIAGANTNVGGQRITLGEQTYTVRGTGLISGLGDIEEIALGSKNGVPVKVKDIASVQLGHAPRLGQVGQDGDPDIVQGIVLMRKGGSTLKTLTALHERIETIRKNHLLPPGMEIVPYYDRGDLVSLTTRTVLENLLMGMGLVVLVLLLFLGNTRASLMTAINIPLALLVAFCGMVLTGTPANLISLGAVDFGIVIDSTVIMAENAVRRLKVSRTKNLKEQIITAAGEVGRPMVFSTLILAVAFLPLFTLKGVEGVIFSPMARTYAFAIGGAILLALTLTPVLGSRLLRKDSLKEKLRRHDNDGGDGHEDSTPVMRAILRVYIPLMERGLRHPKRVLLIVLSVIVLGLGTYPFLGGEFMPKLEEGNLWIRATLPVSASLEQSSEAASRMRAILRRHQEVTQVVSQTGRPDDGTDVTGFFNVELFAPLKPESEWGRGVTKESLTEDLSKELKNAFPGVTFSFSQYISDNVEEALSGVKGENSVKVIGSDLQVNEEKAAQVVSALSTVPGIQDLGLISSLGQPSIRIAPDRGKCARYGLNTGDVAAVVQAAIGGQAVTQVYDGDKVFDLTVRWQPQFRSSLDAIRQIPVSTPDGASIPLGDLAAITQEDSPATIYREDGHRYAPVKFSVRGRDLQGTIAQAQKAVEQQVKMPYGTRLEWSGEINSLKAATERLLIVIPITLLLIAFLAHSAVKDWLISLIVFLSIPMACTGGVLALKLSGIAFSISAAMGFISIFGIAIQDSIIRITHFQRLHRHDGKGLVEAARESAVDRLRPALMTTLVATLGLLPAALSNRIGVQTQKPLAIVVIGGTLTIALVTTVLQPALVVLFHQWKERLRSRAAAPDASGSLPVNTF
jgi:cobalt-zinc-cadmium resistance protein CzcA